MRVQTIIGSGFLRRSPPAQGISFSRSFGTKKPDFNVLLFCPRNEDHLKSFNDEYPTFIKSVNPKSVSVTDVAHNPENNNRAIASLLRNSIAPSMIIPHLVLIGHTKEEADRKIAFFRDSGIKTIFAVRGNPTVLGKDMDYLHHPEGYENMAILMRRIKELAPDMKILVAGYPVKHPAAKSIDDDMDELKKKVDYGADGIVTQHFFETDQLLWFLSGCEKRGINLPVIPSILPIGNPKYLFSFSKSAGVTIPAEVSQILFTKGTIKADSNRIADEDIEKRAVEYSAKQIQELADLNLPQVDRINTYAANNIPFLSKVFEALGMTKDLTEEKSGSRTN
jgi:5,10-methylenetetrahydrofolate reductase